MGLEHLPLTVKTISRALELTKAFAPVIEVCWNLGEGGLLRLIAQRSRQSESRLG